MHPFIDGFYKGRAKLKKGTGKYFDNIDNPKKACYVGAMYYGLYGKTSVALLTDFVRDYPDIRKMVSCPCEHDKEGTIVSILIHLNDLHSTHQWNDAKITKWLESVV